MKTIKKFLRRWLTCEVLGHEWIVEYWQIGNEYHWDHRTWKCDVCKQVRHCSIDDIK